MNEVEKILREIKTTAVELSPVAPGARWYLFGSVLRDGSSANDVDILVVYEDDSHAAVIRGGIAGLMTLPPVHLLLMRGDEEEELQFVKNEGCVEIHPLNPSPRIA